MSKRFITALVLSSVICSAAFAQENLVKEEAVNMFKKLTPNIMVKDVNKTTDYYKQKFAFEFVMGVDEKKEVKMENFDSSVLTWALLKKDDVEIMFQRNDSLIEEFPDLKRLEMGGTFTLYIGMQDVKSFYEKVKNNVEIVKDIHKTFYGADEFVIKDLNGYIIYFSKARE
ncbi:MAG: VOC family protein [bacterium]